jgi:hypothetical protein
MIEQPNLSTTIIMQIDTNTTTISPWIQTNLSTTTVLPTNGSSISPSIQTNLSTTTVLPINSSASTFRIYSGIWTPWYTVRCYVEKRRVLNGSFYEYSVLNISS